MRANTAPEFEGFGSAPKSVDLSMFFIPGEAPCSSLHTVLPANTIPEKQNHLAIRSTPTG
jgi:hypothetical protein